jgi:hypothetical protein
MTDKQRDYWTKQRHGITRDAYLEKRAGYGECSICLRSDVRRLVLDHCHATGRQREFICDDCNVLLGRANDDTEILERAIAYLKRHR